VWVSHVRHKARRKSTKTRKKNLTRLAKIIEYATKSCFEQTIHSIEDKNRSTNYWDGERRRRRNAKGGNSSPCACVASTIGPRYATVIQSTLVSQFAPQNCCPDAYKGTRRGF
jgi:hypothetical protein